MRRLPLLHSQSQAQLEASGKGRGTPLETQARHLIEQAEADILRRGGQHLLQHMVLEERLLVQRRLCVLVIEPFVNFSHKRPLFTILYIVFIVTRDLVSVNRKGPPMDVILPIFSQRLKQLRRDRKITQKAMAELLGKTERHYQAIEAGCINVPATQLIFLAGYFQTSVDYLLGLSDQR